MLESNIAVRAVEIEIEGEGLGSDDVACPFAHQRLRKSHHDAVLDVLVQAAVLLVVRIDIGLDGHHFHGVALLLYIIVDNCRYHRRNNEQQSCSEGQSPAYAARIDPFETAAEEMIYHSACYQHPKRAAEEARVLIPLHQMGTGSEGFSKNQPGPGNLHILVNPLPRYPCRYEKDVRQCAGETLLELAEQPEDEEHLQGVQRNCSYGARRRYPPNPEGCDCVEEKERKISQPVLVLDLVFFQQVCQGEQRHEGHYGQDCCVRHQKRHRRQQREGRDQAPDPESD